ncbi:hypothetical protein [Azospirillum canadense]|uniref:hypothetical protein n=1 Tax=Azospirillum canadense TaxID=403962 RepID=UPI0022270F59|nr:hypothetical protein [Azospirillum canadense]MCW2240731.1 hypothetical protein [Azospirillum canadense]
MRRLLRFFGLVSARDHDGLAAQFAAERVAHHRLRADVRTHFITRDGCGYTRCVADTPAQQALSTARSTLARADHAAWLDTFDWRGRFVDPHTGFWESLSGDIYDADTHSWHDAAGNDDLDADPEPRASHISPT